MYFLLDMAKEKAFIRCQEMCREFYEFYLLTTQKIKNYAGSQNYLRNFLWIADTLSLFIDYGKHCRFFLYFFLLSRWKLQDTHMRTNQQNKDDCKSTSPSLLKRSICMSITLPENIFDPSWFVCYLKKIQKIFPWPKNRVFYSKVLYIYIYIYR